MPTVVQIPSHGAAIAYDPDGHPVVGRSRLMPSTSGGDSVAAGATNAQISDLVLTGRGYMTRLRGVCTVAPGADGTITLKNNVGGNTLLLIPILTTYAKGHVLEITFDVPLAAADDEVPFVLDTGANTGTWTWFVNGYGIRAEVVA